MTGSKRKMEISKHALSTTSMSTCCLILEILAERESKGIIPVVSTEEVLAEYNSKRLERGDGACKEQQIKTHINFLKTLGFIENSSLSEIGRKIAFRCIDGSHDLYVSISFYREIYRSSETFQAVIKRIREGKFRNVAESIEDSAKKEGFNKYLQSHLKKWIEDLTLTCIEEDTIKINRFFEGKAREYVSINEVLVFLESFKDEWDSIQEENFYFNLDKDVFNGTQSVGTIKKLINKLADESYITVNRGKYHTNFILLNKPKSAQELTIHQFLDSN